ncbi:AAA family ATPase [Chitinimonas sp.]|uniref:AAA family ATPase n=1 Tax=Chitinimonas sp. TaxID=1934313 RepID=UPI0035B08AE8
MWLPITMADALSIQAKETSVDRAPTGKRDDVHSSAKKNGGQCVELPDVHSNPSSGDTCTDSDPAELPSAPIFQLRDIGVAKRGVARREKEYQDRVSSLFDAMATRQGIRTVRVPNEDTLVTVGEHYPNFARVIDQLTAEFAFAKHALPEFITFTPKLLDGPPGVGKTMFAEALAKAMNVPFLKISLGSIQGGFEITGTAMHWSNAAPGRLIEILADHAEANPVVLLDEIDKMSDYRSDRVSACLLDLLDPQQAKRLRDDGCNMVFDASKLILIATSNNRDLIASPLLNRMEVFDIALPTISEMEGMVSRIWLELLDRCSLDTGIHLPESTIAEIVASGTSPRQISRALRIALGRALLNKQSVIHSLELPLASKHRRPGFV